MHLLQSNLLLLLFVQVSHWLETTSANTSHTSTVSHSPKSARHGRFGPTSGWIDIDSASVVLSGFSCRFLLRPQIDQVDELSALDPGIVRVFVLWNVSLRCFSWFIFNDTGELRVLLRRGDWCRTSLLWSEWIETLASATI